jgi:hypothetical protein
MMACREATKANATSQPFVPFVASCGEWHNSEPIAKKDQSRRSDILSLNYEPAHSIELHAWRSAERTTFAPFVYQRSSERFLLYFTGSDENEVIWQALKWCEQN